jgi:putative nucleotidyltransferase with HDIG domain
MIWEILFELRGRHMNIKQTKVLKGEAIQPEELFDRISQDNAVLRIFKFHSIRVMYFSVLLGKKMECYNEDLKIAALLHDIGKMGISKKILFKPEKLDDVEYQIVQAHSVIGNNILRKTLGLPKAAVYVRDHHERWDGSGYPRGLKGEKISLQGRIISICDAFDTMTIDRRNYSLNPLTYEDALKELKSCAWEQFDGNIVQTFVEMINELHLPEPEVWADDREKIDKLLSYEIMD